MKIILGSQSRGRQLVLQEAGIEFESIAADIDEEAIRSDDYEELPQLLARAKAEALTKRLGKQDALLITADTVVTYRGELREKPVDEAQAREFLRSYVPEEPAWVNSGVVVTNLATGKQAAGFEKAAVYFKQIPEEVIEYAIQDGYVMGCSGAFALEKPYLQPYVLRYEGSYEAVIGLPLKLTLSLMELVSE